MKKNGGSTQKKSPRKETTSEEAYEQHFPKLTPPATPNRDPNIAQENQDKKSAQKHQKETENQQNQKQQQEILENEIRKKYKEIPSPPSPNRNTNSNHSSDETTHNSKPSEQKIKSVIITPDQTAQMPQNNQFTHPPFSHHYSLPPPSNYYHMYPQQNPYLYQHPHLPPFDPYYQPARPPHQINYQTHSDKRPNHQYDERYPKYRSEDRLEDKFEDRHESRQKDKYNDRYEDRHNYQQEDKHENRHREKRQERRRYFEEQRESKPIQRKQPERINIPDSPNQMMNSPQHDFIALSDSPKYPTYSPDNQTNTYQIISETTESPSTSNLIIKPEEIDALLLEKYTPILKNENIVKIKLLPNEQRDDRWKDFTFTQDFLFDYFKDFDTKLEFGKSIRMNSSGTEIAIYFTNKESANICREKADIKGFARITPSEIQTQNSFFPNNPRHYYHCTLAFTKEWPTNIPLNKELETILKHKIKINALKIQPTQKRGAKFQVSTFEEWVAVLKMKTLFPTTSSIPIIYPLDWLFNTSNPNIVKLEISGLPILPDQDIVKIGLLSPKTRNGKSPITPEAFIHFGRKIYGTYQKPEGTLYLKKDKLTTLPPERVTIKHITIAHGTPTITETTISISSMEKIF